jgi:hypothetical protein
VRLAPLALVVAAVAAVAAVDRDHPVAVAARYGDETAVPMPMAAAADALTTSWFCPGVRTAPGGTGVVSLLNPTESDVAATLTVYPAGDPAAGSAPAPTARPVVATARARTDLDIAALAPGAGPLAFAAALVEVSGTGVLVEQTTTSAQGRSSAPCTTEPSPSWYLADGASTTDASDRVLLFNPFPDDLVVDLTATTEEGSRTSRALQGLVVAPRSLRVVDLGDTVKVKERVAVAATARSGRFVLGRDQTSTGARKEETVALGTPSPSTSWTFASAPKGPAVFTRFVLFNPAATDVDAVVTLYPAAGTPVPAADAPPTSAPSTIPAVRRTVKARSSVFVNLAELAEIPDGSYAATVTADDPLVVERVLAAGDGRAATQLGARVSAQRWWTGGSPGAARSTVSVFNATGLPATVTVRVVGPAGTTDIPGVGPVALPASGSASVALDDAAVASRPVVVTADQPVVVERLAATDKPPAWSSATGIPELR